jgi:hypothetical protein
VSTEAPPDRFRAATYCMLSAADIRDNWPGTSVVFCGEPPIGTITFACIHEHVNQVSACATCAVEIQRCAPDIVCPRCEDGPEPHECLCLVVIDWDSGEKTIVQQPGTAPTGEDGERG